MARNFQLPSVYPITDRFISGLPHEQQIELLIEGGSRFIQVRDKTACSREFLEAVKTCLSYAREKNAKLIVNDRVDIAMVTRADGVHLGHGDLPPEQARKLLGEEAIIGFSTHSVEQAREAANLPIDYIAFGPIFETNSKADRERPVGIDLLKQVRDSVGDFPLVAIGGISYENLEDVLKSGADSVAMIAALLSQPARIGERTSRAFALSTRIR